MKNINQEHEVYTFLERKVKDGKVIVEYEAWVKTLENGKTVIEIEALVEFIVLTQPWVVVGGRFFEYEKSVYRIIENSKIRERILEFIPEDKQEDREIEEIVNLLRSDSRLNVNSDAVNSHVDYMNLKNGLLNLRDMRLYNHSPRYFNTVQVNAYFEDTPNGECFEAFIKDVAPEESIRRLIQQMFGYLLFPHADNKFFLLYGPARTGKTTLLNILSGMFEEDMISWLISDFKNEKYIARLYGKAFNCINDLKPYVKRNSRISKLCSGEPVTKRHSNEMPFTFSNNSSFLCSTNSVSTVETYKKLLKNKLILLPFEECILNENMISGLKDIVLEERNYILKWAVEGLKDLRMNGNKFAIPKRSKELLKISKTKSA